jgi:alpha-glutamyl/putrescinyl thymine pyrophosphorylase clade 1
MASDAPAVRVPVHDAYWRLAAERQRIFHLRAAGMPGPWTDDPILARYRFCNAYRASDRVTQYLIREVIYGEAARGLAAEDAFLRVVAFRLFSRERTWEAIEAATGPLSRRTLDVERVGDLLARRRETAPIYTSAFILSACQAYGHAAKHRNHLALVHDMFRPGRLGRALGQARSLEAVYGALIAWPGIGPFLAYQIAIDLNYSDRLDFTEDEFTMPGPGARRGIKKVFADLAGMTPQQAIQLMVQRQDEEFARLGIPFHDLFGRRLHAIDCQNLFCELDKYSRVRFPELLSDRTRIKREFTPSNAPLALFYPPKWEINDRIGDRA